MIKNCVICGKEFDALGMSKTCSQDCRKIRVNQKVARHYRKYWELEKEKRREYTSLDSTKIRMKLWVNSNADKMNIYRKKQRDKQISELRNSYVADQLKAKDIQPTPENIEAYREYLKSVRLSKKITQTLKDKQNEKSTINEG